MADPDSTITYEDLQSVFHLSSQMASEVLKINHSRLKRACRALNVARWPHRKLASLDFVKEALMTDKRISAQGKEDLQVKIKKEYQAVLDDPDHELSPELTSLRHSLWKAKHCNKRKEGKVGAPSARRRGGNVSMADTASASEGGGAVGSGDEWVDSGTGDESGDRPTPRTRVKASARGVRPGTSPRPRRSVPAHLMERSGAKSPRGALSNFTSTSASQQPTHSGTTSMPALSGLAINHSDAQLRPPWGGNTTGSFTSRRHLHSSPQVDSLPLGQPGPGSWHCGDAGDGLDSAIPPDCTTQSHAIMPTPLQQQQQHLFMQQLRDQHDQRRHSSDLHSASTHLGRHSSSLQATNDPGVFACAPQRTSQSQQTFNMSAHQQPTQNQQHSRFAGDLMGGSYGINYGNPSMQCISKQSPLDMAGSHFKDAYNQQMHGGDEYTQQSRQYVSLPHHRSVHQQSQMMQQSPQQQQEQWWPTAQMQLDLPDSFQQRMPDSQSHNAPALAPLPVLPPLPSLQQPSLVGMGNNSMADSNHYIVHRPQQGRPLQHQQPQQQQQHQHHSMQRPSYQQLQQQQQGQGNGELHFAHSSGGHHNHAFQGSPATAHAALIDYSTASRGPGGGTGPRSFAVGLDDDLPSPDGVQPATRLSSFGEGNDLCGFLQFDSHNEGLPRLSFLDSSGGLGMWPQPSRQQQVQQQQQLHMQQALHHNMQSQQEHSSFGQDQHQEACQQQEQQQVALHAHSAPPPSCTELPCWTSESDSGPKVGHHSASSPHLGGAGGGSAQGGHIHNYGPSSSLQLSQQSPFAHANALSPGQASPILGDPSSRLTATLGPMIPSSPQPTVMNLESQSSRPSPGMLRGRPSNGDGGGGGPSLRVSPRAAESFGGVAPITLTQRGSVTLDLRSPPSSSPRTSLTLGSTSIHSGALPTAAAAASFAATCSDAAQVISSSMAAAPPATLGGAPAPSALPLRLQAVQQQQLQPGSAGSVMNSSMAFSLGSKSNGDEPLLDSAELLSFLEVYGVSEPAAVPAQGSHWQSMGPATDVSQHQHSQVLQHNSHQYSYPHTAIRSASLDLSAPVKGMERNPGVLQLHGQLMGDTAGMGNGGGVANLSRLVAANLQGRDAPQAGEYSANGRDVLYDDEARSIDSHGFDLVTADNTPRVGNSAANSPRTHSFLSGSAVRQGSSDPTMVGHLPSSTAFLLGVNSGMTTGSDGSCQQGDGWGNTDGPISTNSANIAGRALSLQSSRFRPTMGSSDRAVSSGGLWPGNVTPEGHSPVAATVSPAKGEGLLPASTAQQQLGNSATSYDEQQQQHSFQQQLLAGQTGPQSRSSSDMLRATLLAAGLRQSSNSNNSSDQVPQFLNNSASNKQADGSLTPLAIPAIGLAHAASGLDSPSYQLSSMMRLSLLGEALSSVDAGSVADGSGGPASIVAMDGSAASSSMGSYEHQDGTVPVMEAGGLSAGLSFGGHSSPDIMSRRRPLIYRGSAGGNEAEGGLLGSGMLSAGSGRSPYGSLHGGRSKGLDSPLRGRSSQLADETGLSSRHSSPKRQQDDDDSRHASPIKRNRVTSDSLPHVGSRLRAQQLAGSPDPMSLDACVQENAADPLDMWLASASNEPLPSLGSGG